MHITVEFDDAFRAAFADWRRGLSRNPLDRRRLADIFLEALCRRLIQFGGRPPGAVSQPGTRPQRWWCEMTGEVWAAYTIGEPTGVFSRSRVIRLVALERRPPPAPTPAPPPA
jgi:hypothetical protein